MNKDFKKSMNILLSLIVSYGIFFIFRGLFIKDPNDFLFNIIFGAIVIIPLAIFLLFNIQNNKKREEIINAIKNGNMETVRKIINENLSLVNQRDINGNTLLHYAVLEGQEKICELLVEFGSNVNMLNDPQKGMLCGTPFEIAREKGCVKTVEYMASNTKNINARDANGDTLLHKAIVWGNIEMVKLLISKGADVNKRNVFFTTPLSVAQKHGYHDIAALLQAHGAK